jgi:D-erythrulose 1-phosphate 3-epimerase
MELGINLSFAIKRWPEPERWAWIVREDLGLDLVQFSFDLLDPWWPAVERGAMARRVRRAVADHGLQLHSAQLGLTWYTFNGLLHPDPSGRAIAGEWWQRALETAAEIGAPAIGGPLGALSAAETADQATVQQRSSELIEATIAVSNAAAAAGLRGLLIEPTPLPREIPHTIDQSRQMMIDLRGRTGVPVTYVLDVGHALYRPLYGPDITITDWLVPLRGDIGVIHLQNHDYASDAHWGWPDPRGSYDVAALGRSLRDAELGEIPVMLELFYPFELADNTVLENTISSVRHCIAALNA